MIILIDFGSQTAHLISRRIKELGVDCEIITPSDALAQIKELKPKGIIFSGGPASVYEKEAPTIDKKVFNIVQTALQSVVSDPTGTAHILNIDGIPVAGKTGTAQTSGEKKNHAWFIGYTQTEKMKIAFGVFLEHSGSSYYACQVARELLLRMQAEHIL